MGKAEVSSSTKAVDHILSKGEESLDGRDRNALRNYLAGCESSNEHTDEVSERISKIQQVLRLNVSENNAVEPEGAPVEIKVGEPSTEIFQPRIGLRLEQLNVLNVPNRGLAVRFKHGDIDMEKAGGNLKDVSSYSEMGRVRDICASRGLKLIIDSEEKAGMWNESGRIVQAGVPLAEIGKVDVCNYFIDVDESGLNPCSWDDYPNYHARSLGVASSDVSNSLYFKRYKDLEEFMIMQQKAGFRGEVAIQASYKHEKDSGVSLPFVAEIMVTDTGLRIIRDEETIKAGRYLERNLLAKSRAEEETTNKTDVDKTMVVDDSRGSKERIGEENWNKMSIFERKDFLRKLEIAIDRKTKWWGCQTVEALAQIGSFDDLPSDLWGRMIMAITKDGFLIKEYERTKKVMDTAILDESPNYHQMTSGISLPSELAILEEVLNKEQILAIFDYVGEKELRRIAEVDHSNNDLNNVRGGDPRWKAIFEREGADLNVLRKAIIHVLHGVSKPWIMGFASDFAKSLLEYAMKVRAEG